MSKVVLDDVAFGYNLQKINTNFQKIETALNDNVLWRNAVAGESNALIDDVDMNGQRLYNLPEPVLDTEPLRMRDVADGGSRSVRVPAGETIPALPNAATRASKLQGYDALGNPIMIVPVDGTAVTLALDLANTVNAAKGPALVGLGFISYPVGTIGHAILSHGVTPSMYGAVGNGIADDTLPLQNWKASVFPKIGENKTFYVTGAIELPDDLDGKGMVLKCSSAARVTVTGTVTALPALSVSPTAGVQTLTFSSAHGLAVGDSIVIYNATASSFSAVRAEYKAGEYCSVGDVTSATVVTLAAPTYAGYTAGAVSISKLNKRGVTLSNINIIGPDAVAPAIKLTYCTELVLNNVNVQWANYLGIYLDRCFNVTVNGGSTVVPKSGVSDCFGLFIGNTQNVTVNGGTWHSLRNGADCGGDNVSNCVPNRNIKYNGSYVSNTIGSTGPAFNLHGNTEHVKFDSGYIDGGASFEGSEIYYTDSTITSKNLGPNYMVGGGSECLGGTYSIRNCVLTGGPAWSVGMVRISNPTNGLRNSLLVIKDCVVTLGSCDTFARNDMGSSTFKANADIDNITFADGAPSMGNVLRMVGTGAAGDGDFVIVDNIHNGKVGAPLYYAVSGYGATVKARLMRQSGSISITPTVGSNTAVANATYRYSFGSKVPKVQVTLVNGVINSKTLVPGVSAISATLTTITMRTGDSLNMGLATPDIVANWSAEVEEL